MMEASAILSDRPHEFTTTISSSLKFRNDTPTTSPDRSFDSDWAPSPSSSSPLEYKGRKQHIHRVQGPHMKSLFWYRGRFHVRMILIRTVMVALGVAMFLHAATFLRRSFHVSVPISTGAFPEIFLTNNEVGREVGRELGRELGREVSDEAIEEVRRFRKFVDSFTERETRRRLIPDSMSSLSNLTAARDSPPALLVDADRKKFTIRLTAGSFAERTYVAVEHYAKCEAVEQIQLLWDSGAYSERENERVEEKMEKIGNGKVLVDKRRETTLHDKFELRVEPPTIGVLMLEDENVFLCEALESGFYRWTRHPERILGYEPRFHKENSFQWEYSTYTEAMTANRYSMVLISSAFVHRDYLSLYTSQLPRSMYNAVVDSNNCEDIAMTLFVSSLTGGKPPLLADYWATQARMKLYSPHAPRRTEKRATRHACVDTFITELQLRNRDGKMYDAELYRGLLTFGDKVEEDKGKYYLPGMKGVDDREIAIRKKVAKWTRKNFKDKLGYMKKTFKGRMIKTGLVHGSKEWNNRFEAHSTDSKNKH